MLLGSSLTARDVRDAIEDRISRSIYPLGSRLPPVRSIAAELGTSPSTISRAIQLMVRDGWLDIQERRYVRVMRSVPLRDPGPADVDRTIKALTHRWRLGGGRKEHLIARFEAIVGEAYQDDARFVFVECNNDDLNFMSQQIEEDVPGVPIAKSLIKDLDVCVLRRERSLVLVPYYHYAEVKQIVGTEVPIIPVHSSPSVDTLDALVNTEAGTRVLVVGHNQRSIKRLSTLVTDYADVATKGVTIDQGQKLKAMVATADLIVAVKAAEPTLNKLTECPPVLLVRFALESSLRDRILMAKHTEVPQTAAPGSSATKVRARTPPETQGVTMGPRRLSDAERASTR